MGARDDYPYRERNVPMYASDRTLHESMCDEIDELRAVAAELRRSLWRYWFDDEDSCIAYDAMLTRRS